MPRSIHPLSRRAVLLSLASGAAWHRSVRARFRRSGESKSKSTAPGPGDRWHLVSVNGAARWLEQSQFIVSSLEIGRVGYVERGGDEFGYSYTYTLAGQPNGVSIDTETGILTIASPLGVGAHRFEVIAANRRAPAKVARFAGTLFVRQGVSANRVDDQILHKTYIVDSGAYGLPRGQDYTQVLANVRRAIIADQNSAGDGNLRATIWLRPGRLYDYTNNRWPVGIQYLAVESDPNYSSTGTRPRLRNVRGDFTFDSEISILICGGGTAFDLVQGDIKRYSPKIFTAEPGAIRFASRTRQRRSTSCRVGGTSSAHTISRWGGTLPIYVTSTM